MGDLKELQSMKDIFNHFQSLGAHNLAADENIYARKIGKFSKLIS